MGLESLGKRGSHTKSTNEVEPEKQIHLPPFFFDLSISMKHLPTPVHIYQMIPRKPFDIVHTRLSSRL